MSVLTSLKTHWVAWAWQRTPNCDEMARLSYHPLERHLLLGPRLRMRLHLLICVWWHRHLKQSN